MKKVKVITPFYHSGFGLRKAGEVFDVLTDADIAGLVEVVPEEAKKEVKKTKKAKQA